jgi:hypothetical protein
VTKLFARLALATVFACGSVAALAADPTVDDIYRATTSGRLDEAQTMIGQVLRDHPNSAKAHFVAAEVYARAGRLAAAREQLNEAQTLDPKNSFANPRAISELRAELSQGTATRQSSARRSGSGFPLGWVFVLVGAILALWMLFRRRAVAQPMSVPGPIGNGPYANPGAYGPYGYGPQPPGGSGLGRSLASGLAVGAGVVAGEELARHFIDGDRRGPLGTGFEESGAPPANGDMGGNDFGVSDPGSWGDGGGDFGAGGGDFGGGDDWT